MQFFHVNEEFPVSVSHQLALITSLPFVHTARRYYRLNDRSEVFGPADTRALLLRESGNRAAAEDDRTRPFRGSKSRNKVSVGEPAEGSLMTGPRGVTGRHAAFHPCGENTLACPVERLLRAEPSFRPRGRARSPTTSRVDRPRAATPTEVSNRKILKTGCKTQTPP